MSRRGLDAIVVGAGLVGAAAALGLARIGLRVAIVEAAQPRAWRDDAPPDLRVFAISPASSDLLAELGVWPAVVAARAAPYRRMHVWDAAAPDASVTFRSQDVGAPHLGHIVEQSLIQTSLWHAILAEPGIARHCPARVVGIEHTQRGIDVELQDGSRLSATILVGADGSASPLRERLGIVTRGRDYGAQGVVGFIRTARPHEDTAWQRFQPSGPLAVLPFTEARSSIVWTLPDVEAQRVLALDDTDFSRELERAFGSRLGTMTPISPRAGFPLRLKLAERYAADRAVLVGDAAHGVHPLAGQGVNLGFQDVTELLQLVRIAHAAGQDIGAPSVLSRYARRRKSDTTMAGYAFDGIERLFGTDAVLPTLLRGPALGLVDKLPPLKRFFVRHASGR
ncbi:UbiH/UbiF/VisC/COQ6 family ubiquinone biosynthesis hydroxylase [Xanthomonadaceae bacterium XH05]|nr:UbiH/UbiF/VisC/COQ6 family ubiquinone biosynthesis hydroxylase [Xanthomonadaceae bacterium XH05]